MYRRITVPLDGTAESEQALLWALMLARKANCPIDLVYVATPPVLGTERHGRAAPDRTDIDEARRAARRRLQSVADDLTATGITVTPIVLDSEGPDTLVDHLATSDPDLIVMTTHDSGRVERLLLGTVAGSVVRHVHTPMLLVRPADGVPPPSAPRAGKRILIPLDGSPFGERIIPHAAALASLLESDVTLLAVRQPIAAAVAMAADVTAPGIVPAPVGVRENDGDAEQIEMENDVLERTAKALRASGLAVQTTVLVDDQPAQAIVDYAKRQSIDVIAMTTHGRGALERIVAGRVAQHVLRTSHAPVLVFRPTQT